MNRPIDIVWLPRPVLTSIGLTILLSVVLSAGISSVQADQAFDSFRQAREAALIRCDGAFKGKRPTTQELAQVLEHHQQWVRDLPDIRHVHRSERKNDPRRANLCGARLLDLKAVRLDGANLSAANLGQTNLTDASLWGADLSYIFATRAVFSGAVMNTGTLEGAWLQGAKFDNANLPLVNLRRAFLQDTNLRDASLAAADLADAIFEPELGSLPRFFTLIGVKNLEKLRFNISPHGLVELREAFNKAGLRAQERQVTYAIKHNERLRAGRLESALNYVLFEVTTEWGMVPSRALHILAFLIALFAFPYAVVLRTRGDDGIWRVWAVPRLRDDLGQEDPVRLRLGWLGALGLGLYFSFLSAFHIGWREFNVGDWIARIHPREYTFRATGWVRSVAGVQSLISVYLLAIWALTYFGRPFE